MSWALGTGGYWMGPRQRRQDKLDWLTSCHFILSTPTSI